MRVYFDCHCLCSDMRLEQGNINRCSAETKPNLAPPHCDNNDQTRQFMRNRAKRSSKEYGFHWDPRRECRAAAGCSPLSVLCSHGSWNHWRIRGLLKGLCIRKCDPKLGASAKPWVPFRNNPQALRASPYWSAIPHAFVPGRKLRTLRVCWDGTDYRRYIAIFFAHACSWLLSRWHSSPCRRLPNSTSRSQRVVWSSLGRAVGFALGLQLRQGSVAFLLQLTTFLSWQMQEIRPFWPG